MQIELHLKAELNFRTRAYDPDEDDVRSILMDVCRAIGKQSQFVVSGFGQERWPVDVETDLAVFLEQLPDVLRAVHEGRTTSIDFYEQGVERCIALDPSNREYLAVCTSWTLWKPDPATEKLPREELEKMLLTAREAFMRTLGDMAPELSRHPWILQWLRAEHDQK